MKKYFECENCHTKYDTEEEASACEDSTREFETGCYYTDGYGSLRLSVDRNSMINIKEHFVACGYRSKYTKTRYHLSNRLCNGQSIFKKAKPSDYDELEKELTRRLNAVKKLKKMLENN